MKPEDLHKVWDAPDNTQLTANQYSIRLPIHVAAKISALCEMYPKKSRTEIIGDLLSTALDQFAAAFPSVAGQVIGCDEAGKPEYEEVGPWVRFDHLVKKHLADLEKEQGKQEVTSGTPKAATKAKKSKGKK